MSEGLFEANTLRRLEPWLKRGATALGYLKPVTKAAAANKRGAGLAVLAVVFVARRLMRNRIRPRRQETLPAKGIWGAAVTTWADVYERLEQSAPASSTEYAKAQVAGLEAWCGGDPDFGYLYWTEDNVDIVVLKGDRFLSLDVMDSGEVWSTSALVSSLGKIETTEARDGTLSLQISHEPGGPGWFWIVQDPGAREALLSLTSQLRQRSTEVK